MLRRFGMPEVYACVVAIDRVVYAIAGGPTPGGSQTGIVEFWNLP